MEGAMMENFVHVGGIVVRDAKPPAGATVMYFCLKVPSNGDMVLVDCVSFPDTWEQCDGHLDEGEAVDVTGYLIYRTWTDTKGNRRSGLEVAVETIDFLED